MKKENLLEFVRSGGVVVADGAMGTMLLPAEMHEASPPDAVNLSDPCRVEEVTRQYLDSGAELLQTNTFGASPLRLSAAGLEDRCEEINRSAVNIAQRVAGSAAWISASIGPCGFQLQPFGSMSPEQFKANCLCQVQTLADCGIDIFCIETMMDVEEAALALEVVREAVPGATVMVSFTFENRAGGFFTPFGNSLWEVAERFEAEGADVIGANCGTGLEDMIETARRFKQATRLPVLARPNAGLPEYVDGKVTWFATPEDFADSAEELVAAGVSIIGGCCGSTPDHIRSIRKVVDRVRTR